MPLTLSAQYIDLGQDPSSIHWRQINTKDFQLIYPDFFEENAQHLANIFTLLYNSEMSLKQKPRKMSIIVHARGAVSNGSAGWAPKKSDLYTIPPQEASDIWAEHLCVHEFRHIVQYDNINQGITKVLGIVFGEQAAMAVTGLLVPMWFIEGDAVAFETAVGHIGRGRSPEFLNEMKAQLVEKGSYSYDKAVLGSYKDFVPNRYTLGYFLTAKARTEYGAEIASNALARTGKHFYTLSPFKAPPLYKTHIKELTDEWQRDTSLVSSYDTLATQNKYYTNYYYPTPYKDGQVIAYKNGFQQRGAFVLLSQGKERILTPTGILYDQKYALNKETLVWSEYLPHARWEHGGRRVIVSYDIATKKYKYHRHPINRFSPFTISNNWGLVEVDEQNKASIVILDSLFENELHRIPAKKGELFIHPSSDGTHIFTVVQDKNGHHIEAIKIIEASKSSTSSTSIKSIGPIQPDSVIREVLTDSYWYEIDNPVCSHNTLYFRASFNGNNSLYAKDLQTGNISTILTTPFGVRFPATKSQDTLYFSFYTSDGYKIGKTAVEQLLHTPVEMKTYPLADSLKKFDAISLEDIRDSVFESANYHKFPHLLNIHSWGPMYVDPSEQKINAGLTVLSQNKLSTLSLTAGLIWTDFYNQNGAWMLNANYKAFWPKFSLDLKSGRSKTTLPLVEPRNNNVVAHLSPRFTEAQATMQLPFNLSRRNFYRSISPYIRYKTEILHGLKIVKAYAQNIQYDDSPMYYQMLEYGVTLSNYTYTTAQERNPRWGQSVQTGYWHSPMGGEKLGQQVWLTGNLYFPGISTNHSFNLYCGIQTGTGNRIFSQKVSSPRGMGPIATDFYTVRSTYELPLFYPDFRVSGLFYMKAIYGAAFFDYTQTQQNKQYSSYGIELKTDSHVLRLPFPLNLGIRGGYESLTKSLFANILFSVNYYF